jgi:hypothetical protein
MSASAFSATPRDPLSAARNGLTRRRGDAEDSVVIPRHHLNNSSQPFSRLVIHHDDLQPALINRRLRLRLARTRDGAHDLAIDADRAPVGVELETDDFARIGQRALMCDADTCNGAVSQIDTRHSYRAADGSAQPDPSKPAAVFGGAIHLGKLDARGVVVGRTDLLAVTLHLFRITGGSRGHAAVREFGGTETATHLTAPAGPHGSENDGRDKNEAEAH